MGILSSQHASDPRSLGHKLENLWQIGSWQNHCIKQTPNRTWEEMIQRQLDKGLTGDDIYKEIIASSHRSRKSVNKSLGLE